MAAAAILDFKSYKFLTVGHSKVELLHEKKDRTGEGKRSQKGYISPICGEAPTEAMYIKICLVILGLPLPSYHIPAHSFHCFLFKHYQQTPFLFCNLLTKFHIFCPISF